MTRARATADKLPGMGALHIVLLVIAIIAVVLAVVVIVARVVVGKVRAAGEARISAEFTPDEVVLRDPMANYFGLESKGGNQIRGNGALVLADSRLWFARPGSATALDIALSSVTAVDLVRAHAGKSAGRALLRVSFGEDSAAWYLGDLEKWRSEILARVPGLV